MALADGLLQICYRGKSGFSSSVDSIVILFYCALGVSLDAADTIAVCIMNLWGYTEILI